MHACMQPGPELADILISHTLLGIIWARQARACLDSSLCAMSVDVQACRTLTPRCLAEEQSVCCEC